MKWILFSAAALLMTNLVTNAQAGNPPDFLQQFQIKAAKFKSLISLPHFEVTTNEVRTSVKGTIQAGNAALDKIGTLDPRKVTFENTVRALDDMGYHTSLTDNRLSLIKETSTNA